MVQSNTSENGKVDAVSPYVALEQLERCDRARISIPRTNHESKDWMEVEPVLVDRCGWKAVIREPGAPDPDSPDIRVYKLVTAGSATDGTHKLEAYHLCEQYGSTYIGDLLDLRVVE